MDVFKAASARLSSSRSPPRTRPRSLPPRNGPSHVGPRVGTAAAVTARAPSRCARCATRHALGETRPDVPADQPPRLSGLSNGSASHRAKPSARLPLDLWDRAPFEWSGSRMFYGTPHLRFSDDPGLSGVSGLRRSRSRSVRLPAGAEHTQRRSCACRGRNGVPAAVAARSWPVLCSARPAPATFREV
jgi:hypothetical protein